MKKIMITSITLLLSLSLFSQNEIAYVTVNSNYDDAVYTAPKKMIRNIDYVNAIDNRDLSIQIKTFQNLVANYDITKQECYNSNKMCTYDVVFKDDKKLISATYNKEGIIVRSLERYKAIKLPYEISSQIIKENPGWEYEDVKCSISYKQNEVSNISYKVKIKKGNQTKTLNILANNDNRY